jgi:hypothetical protein
VRVLLRKVVEWSLNWRRGFNILRVINVRCMIIDQPQRAPGAQRVVVYLYVLCGLYGFFLWEQRSLNHGRKIREHPRYLWHLCFNVF